MSYTELFYWLTVADNAKTFFGFFAVLFILIFSITQFARILSHIDGAPSDEYMVRCNKWTWYSTPLLILFLSLWIFTPNKRDALLIVAGGTTLDYLANDSVAKQIPRELSTFVVSELKNMAKEAKVDLGIANEKDKVLEIAKGLTGIELIELLKENPEYKDLILNNVK